MPLQKWLHYSSLRCRNQHGRPLNVLLNNSKPQYVPFISPIICHHISQPSFIFPAGNTHLCSSSGRREKGVKVNQYKFKGIVCPGVIYSFWWCFKPALGKKTKKKHAGYSFTYNYNECELSSLKKGSEAPWKKPKSSLCNVWTILQDWSHMTWLRVSNRLKKTKQMMTEFLFLKLFF